MLPIAAQTAGPNGLNIFCGHSWVAGGCYRVKKIEIFCFQNKKNAGPFGEDLIIFAINLMIQLLKSS